MSIKWKSKHSGFTLYESVIALMITVMTLGVLQQSLQILKTVQNTTFRDQLRWHITQEKLQTILKDNQIKLVTDDKVVYFDRQKKKSMVIEKYPAGRLFMLRLTTSTNGGHEPIMMNLNKISIEKNRNLVIITTENHLGQKSEMYLSNDV